MIKKLFILSLLNINNLSFGQEKELNFYTLSSTSYKCDGLACSMSKEGNFISRDENFDNIQDESLSLAYQQSFLEPDGKSIGKDHPVVKVSQARIVQNAKNEILLFNDLKNEWSQKIQSELKKHPIFGQKNKISTEASTEDDNSDVSLQMDLMLEKDEKNKFKKFVRFYFSRILKIDGKFVELSVAEKIEVNEKNMQEKVASFINSIQGKINEQVRAHETLKADIQVAERPSTQAIFSEFKAQANPEAAHDGISE